MELVNGVNKLTHTHMNARIYMILDKPFIDDFNYFDC